MTNAVQSITSATTSPSQRPAARRRRLAPDSLLLPLRGGVPQTVHVALHPDNSVTFSQKGGPEFSGITWETNGYALMLTFVLSPNIQELVPTTPSLWFSDTFHAAGVTSQMCCVNSVLGVYSFTVEPTDVSQLLPDDPQIIVTPIGGGTAGDNPHTRKA
jgi:hypothetical protein